MNNKFVKILPVITAAFLLTACSEDDVPGGDTLPEGKYPLEIAGVSITADVTEQPWTRVMENPDGGSSTWEGDDLIGVQVGNGTPGTYRIDNPTSGTVTPITPAYWQNTGQNTVTAWYPTENTVRLDGQTGGLAYVLQYTDNVNYNTPVTLSFTHQLAKVRVKLTGKPEVLERVRDVKLKTFTTCTHDKGGNILGSNEGWITMWECSYSDVTNSWEANVVPGHVITSFQLMSTTGTTTEGTVNGGGINPVKGAINTLNIHVYSSEYYKQIFEDAFFNDDGTPFGDEWNGTYYCWASDETNQRIITDVLKTTAFGGEYKTVTAPWGEEVYIGYLPNFLRN